MEESLLIYCEECQRIKRRCYINVLTYLLKTAFVLVSVLKDFVGLKLERKEKENEKGKH